MYNLQNITFINPEYFWLFLIVPVILYFFYKKEKSGINFINLGDLQKVFKTNNYKFYLKISLLFIILTNFIIILANPNIINSSEKVKKNGIDIIIALDISGSMQANDLKPDRIEAAKNVMKSFIKEQKTNRLGLIVYAGKPFTSIPLTFDYNILEENISNLSINNINQYKRGLDGTATGDGILMANTLFEKTEEKENNKREKVIILLTDGNANTGVDPKISGKYAKEKGIKIYTVGIGNKKGGYITVDNGIFKEKRLMEPLNDTPLKEIAEITDGEYFRATDNNTFENIFKQLEKLEKNDIEVEIKKQYKQYYQIFLYSLIFFVSIFGYLMISSLEFRRRKDN